LWWWVELVRILVLAMVGGGKFIFWWGLQGNREVAVGCFIFTAPTCGAEVLDPSIEVGILTPIGNKVRCSRASERIHTVRERRLTVTGGLS
jgi:hypothetical protein